MFVSAKHKAILASTEIPSISVITIVIAFTGVTGAFINICKWCKDIIGCQCGVHGCRYCMQLPNTAMHIVPVSQFAPVHSEGQLHMSGSTHSPPFRHPPVQIAEGYRNTIHQCYYNSDCIHCCYWSIHQYL